MKQKQPKILLFDIEASNLDADFGSVHCVGYKWLHEKRVHCVSKWDFAHWERDINADIKVLQAVAPIFAEADFLCAHYGAKLNGWDFDLRFLNAKLLEHGLPAIPKQIMGDTHSAARKNLRLSSNRLGNIAEHLGCTYQKYHLNKKDWKRVLNRDKKACERMARYCRNDVRTLEAVFLKLRQFFTNIPNHNLWLPAEKQANARLCPSCGGTNIESLGWTTTRTARYRRFRCKRCRAVGRFDKFYRKPRKL